MNYRLPKNNHKGFTLLEIMCVLTVLAIIFSISIPSFIGSNDRYLSRICKSSAENVVDDLRAELVSFRLEKDADNNGITEIFIDVAEDYVGSDYIFSEQQNKGYNMKTDCLCSDGEDVTISWTVTKPSDDKDDYADVLMTVFCSHHGELYSDKVRVFYK